MVVYISTLVDGRLGQYPPDKMADAYNPTPTQSYIHLCTQMYNPYRVPMLHLLPTTPSLPLYLNSPSPSHSHPHPPELHLRRSKASASSCVSDSLLPSASSAFAPSELPLRLVSSDVSTLLYKTLTVFFATHP